MDVIEIHTQNKMFSKKNLKDHFIKRIKKIFHHFQPLHID